MESPSFYNIDEALVIGSIIDKLLTSSTVTVTTRDIGVICAYQAAVKQVRRLLRSQGKGAVRVGIIDDLQGQEEKIIIVSTVVSTKFGPRVLKALSSVSCAFSRS